MDKSSFIYVVLAFFAYVMYHQIRTILEYRSAEKRATVPVKARVIEVREEERWETETNTITDRTESVRKIILVPIWEYEVKGAAYRHPASASEGLPTAREGDTETLYIDPEIPWEPWRAIGADQYTAITKTILLAAAFVVIVSLMMYTSTKKVLIVGAVTVFIAGFLMFGRHRRM
jgi:hypothetical protein